MTDRYRLLSKDILRWVMDHPKRGAAYSVRTLAEAIGPRHRSKLGHLLSGYQQDCDAEVAHGTAEACGVHVGLLFAPASSTKQSTSTPGRSRSAENTPHTP